MWFQAFELASLVCVAPCLSGAVSAAFQLGVPWSGVFLLLTLLVVGIAVPTPGGVGGFHYAFRLGVTEFYAVADDRAVAAAVVLHAITFWPITLVGLMSAVQEGLTFGGPKLDRPA
jgi:uncharacterized membrane protein YbhN (UPF0104 family)